MEDGNIPRIQLAVHPLAGCLRHAEQDVLIAPLSAPQGHRDPAAQASVTRGALAWARSNVTKHPSRIYGTNFAWVGSKNAPQARNFGVILGF